MNTTPDVAALVNPICQPPLPDDDDGDDEDNAARATAATDAHFDRLLAAVRHQNFNANFESKAGDTPLLVAAQAGRVTAVRDLLFLGADPNQASSVSQTTPLQAAVASRSGEVVRLLLSAGADRDAPLPARFGYPALVYAVSMGDGALEATQALLDGGAPAEWVDPSTGRSLLQSACEAMAVRTVKALVRAGAEVGFVDSQGSTALLDAVQLDNADDEYGDAHMAELVEFLVCTSCCWCNTWL